MKLIYLLLWCIPSVVLAQVYSTSVTDSRWQLQAGAFSCRLVHKIEGFGEWSVGRKAGQSEQSFLSIDQSLKQKKKIELPAGAYKLMTAPPAWKPQMAPELIGELNQAKADTELVFPQSLLPAVYALLNQSTPVLVSYQGKPLRIQLQPYQFKESYKLYTACVANLIPFTFEQITRTTLYYQAEDTALSAANQQALNKIIRYAQADPNRIISILVDGHSDTQKEEGAADKLAKTQADWVATYLKEKGIPENKMLVRSHGGKYPVANNLLVKEKAKNRRVTVRLEDETIRQKNAEKIAEIKKQEETKAAVQASSSLASSSVESTKSSAPDFGDKLPIELELERMVEGQDLEKPSPSEITPP